jgi:hypothetical protein
LGSTSDISALSSLVNAIIAANAFIEHEKHKYPRYEDIGNPASWLKQMLDATSQFVSSGEYDKAIAAFAQFLQTESFKPAQDWAEDYTLMKLHLQNARYGCHCVECFCGWD